MSNERKGYPQEWSEYIKSAAYINPNDFGFRDNKGDINRFAARFRAANKFRGIVLEGYREDTANGYSALCQVMFTWSAFETFEKIAKLNRSDISEELERFGAIEVLNQIRVIDKDNKFYQFIYERVNDRHKKELDSYFNQDSCNIIYLASAIRHIFAHGWLSPHANQADPKVVDRICHILSQFLLDFMDREFSSRIDKCFDGFKNS